MEEKPLSSLPNIIFQLYAYSFYHFQARHESTDCGMKQILSEIIPEKQKQVKEFRSNSGGMVVGEVTVDMVSGELDLCLQS